MEKYFVINVIYLRCFFFLLQIPEGNVFLTKDMDVKIIDFGSARNLIHLTNQQNKGSRVKFDIVGIIRIFSLLYSGFDFNDMQHAMEILQANNLHTVCSETIISIML